MMNKAAIEMSTDSAQDRLAVVQQQCAEILVRGVIKGQNSKKFFVREMAERALAARQLDQSQPRLAINTLNRLHNPSTYTEYAEENKCTYFRTMRKFKRDQFMRKIFDGAIKEEADKLVVSYEALRQNWFQLTLNDAVEQAGAYFSTKELRDLENSIYGLGEKDVIAAAVGDKIKNKEVTYVRLHGDQEPAEVVEPVAQQPTSWRTQLKEAATALLGPGVVAAGFWMATKLSQPVQTSPLPVKVDAVAHQATQAVDASVNMSAPQQGFSIDPIGLGMVALVGGVASALLLRSYRPLERTETLERTAVGVTGAIAVAGMAACGAYDMAAATVAAVSVTAAAPTIAHASAWSLKGCVNGLRSVANKLFGGNRQAQQFVTEQQQAAR